MAHILVKNGTLIDGTGGKPLENAAILIKDGKFKAVGTVDTIPHVDDVTVLDAQGGCI